MEILSVYDVPIFGTDSLWQFDAGIETTDSGNCLSDIIFDTDVNFDELLSPSKDSMNSRSTFSPSQNIETPFPYLTTTSQSFDSNNTIGCNRLDDFGSCNSCSSTSSQLTQIPRTITQASPDSSISFANSEAGELLSPKIETIRRPTRKRSPPEKCKKLPPIDFRRLSSFKPDPDAVREAKEMLYRIAVMRPVNLGHELPSEKATRKNVQISRDPQTAAARRRRERLSEKLRVLQRLVPGGSKMDIATMLDEAANYLKYLQSQLSTLKRTTSLDRTYIRF